MLGLRALHIIFLFHIHTFGTFGLLKTQEDNFVLVTEDNADVVPIDVFVECTEPLCCAMFCQKNLQCFSFSFNELTSECTLGSWVYPSSVGNLRSGNEVIYTSAAPCYPSSNTSFLSNGTESVCVWISSNRTTYTQSAAFCRGIGMNLYTPKSLPKLYIIKTVAETLQEDVWVGLNDVSSENNFVWEDDQSSLNLTLRTLLFAPGQPNTNSTQEDCVTYSLTQAPLNDIVCSYNRTYVCERKLTKTKF
ncbi:CD209 antigen protein 2 [Biomphalaria glabrata]|nr:CD209 antigen protein 2 [Biomphalaria glabrata]